MAYRHQSYPLQNNTYNSIRDQAERETQGLDRTYIEVYRPSNTLVATNRQIEGSPQSKWQPEFSQKRGSFQVELTKKNQIKNRIKEIIDLCKDQNTAVNRQMNSVIEQEKGIYNLLSQGTNEVIRTAPTAAPHFTPTKLQDNSYRKQRKPQSIILQGNYHHLSEEAQQIIADIERRAVSEIERVKGQLAFQRKKNDDLEHQLAYYRSQGGSGAGGEGQLRSRIAFLQNMLQKQQQGQGGFDFNALYEQGEQIRQDTIRLLKLKESKLDNDEEKRHLRQEISRLQRRIEQFQMGRPSKGYEVINEEYSPIAPGHKRSNSYRNSANEYQSLVMQMRKLTGGN